MYTTPDWQWDFRVPDLLQAQINAIYDCDVDIADCHRTLARFRLAGGWDWDTELIRPGRAADVASTEYMDLVYMGIDMNEIATKSRAGCRNKISQHNLECMLDISCIDISLVWHIQALRAEKWRACQTAGLPPSKVGWWGPKQAEAVREAIKPPRHGCSAINRSLVGVVSNFIDTHMHLGWKAEKWLRTGGCLTKSQKELVRTEVSVLKITPEEAHGTLGVCDEGLANAVYTCQRMLLDLNPNWSVGPLVRRDSATDYDLLLQHVHDAYTRIKPLHTLVRWKRHYLEYACEIVGDSADEWIERGWVDESKCC